MMMKLVCGLILAGLMLPSAALSAQENSRVVQQGRFAYIHLPSAGIMLSRCADQTLKALAEYEAKNPEWEIESWKFESRYGEAAGVCYADGIWLTLKKKTDGGVKTKQTTPRPTDKVGFIYSLPVRFVVTAQLG
ncbi:MAG: hypothetical protein ACM3NH_04465 [Candidatus Saccharibacteria bacterium]